MVPQRTGNRRQPGTAEPPGHAATAAERSSSLGICAGNVMVLTVLVILAGQVLITLLSQHAVSLPGFPLF